MAGKKELPKRRRLPQYGKEEAKRIKRAEIVWLIIILLAVVAFGWFLRPH